MYFRERSKLNPIVSNFSELFCWTSWRDWERNIATFTVKSSAARVANNRGLKLSWVGAGFTQQRKDTQANKLTDNYWALVRQNPVFSAFVRPSSASSTPLNICRLYIMERKPVCQAQHLHTVYFKLKTSTIRWMIIVMCKRHNVSLCCFRRKF